MSKMTPEEANKILNNWVEWLGSNGTWREVTLTEEEGAEISQLIARQQKMIERACAEMACRPQCPDINCPDPEKFKDNKDCTECWLKWLEQEGEK